MTLTQMAVSYRTQDEVLRRRIQLVRRLPVRTEAEEIARADRLRILEAMQRDVRDMAVICERYYQRSYHMNQKYAL